MEDSLGVHVFNTLANLFDYCLRLILSETFLLFEDSEKMPIWRILKQHIEVRLIIEEPVQGDKVGVMQIELDFDFSSKLVVHLLFYQGLLLDDLEGEDKPCLYVLG